jgi:hypothetical protein
MPTYTLRNIKTSNEWDVICSYDELQTILDETSDVVRVLSAPKIVTGVGTLHGKIPDGFKDKLNQIKKGSGRNNTIRT